MPVEPSIEDHLHSLAGKTLRMPGAQATAFIVVEVSSTSVHIRNTSSDFLVSREWLDQAWARLVGRGELVRSGLSPTTAQYRSGYIFALLAAHPKVVVTKPFPTKLTLPKAPTPG